MAKIKTNRAAAKRFKRTGTGKYAYTRSYHSHILTTKNAKRKRNLRKGRIVDGTNMKALRRLLPNG